MFLTLALLRNGVPGRQWIGKHRRPRRVTLLMKQNVIKRLEIEAENEYWLSQPFMTREKEYCHNTERRFAKFEVIKSQGRLKFPEHKYAADHLDQLNVTRKWTPT
uniref:Mitochondrial ribosomal protein L57 n=1 Tax=Sphenodon punctatus TaxID=8508 RepID=A0A8D0H5H7_SPHPU